MVVAGLLFPAAPAALAAQPQDRNSPCAAIPGIRVFDLPQQARETPAVIRAAGPSPCPGRPRVGIREGLLSPPARATCREYTVMTQSRNDCGTRGIVAVKRSEFHYTKDHYHSFRRIIE